MPKVIEYKDFRDENGCGLEIFTLDFSHTEDEGKPVVVVNGPDPGEYKTIGKNP